MGLDTLALLILLTKLAIFRFRVFFQACSLRNKVGDPPSPFFNITNCSPQWLKVSEEKIDVGKFLRKGSLIEGVRLINYCVHLMQVSLCMKMMVDMSSLPG